MIKILRKLEIEETSQLNKGHLTKKPIANIILNGERQFFSPKIRTKQGCSLSLQFNIILDALTSTIREEKGIKGIQVREEEVKLLYS